MNPNERRLPLVPAALLLFVAAGLTPLTPLAIADDSGRRVVRIETKTHCDDGDCEPAEVMVLGDGEFEWNGESFGELLGGFGGTAGYLGVQLTDLTSELREHFGVPSDVGVMVGKVVDDSPAQRAGLEAGDIITLLDGESVTSSVGLARAVGKLEEGHVAALEIWRDGQVEQRTATIEERERKMAFHGHGLQHMFRNGEGKSIRIGPGAHGQHHVMRFGDGDGVKVLQLDCDGDDCDAGAAFGDFDCGGADECEVKVTCSDGDCECVVNGEETDCAGLPGVPGE